MGEHIANVGVTDVVQMVTKMELNLVALDNFRNERKIVTLFNDSHTGWSPSLTWHGLQKPGGRQLEARH